jgi:hypothetical protein
MALGNSRRVGPTIASEVATVSMTFWPTTMGLTNTLRGAGIATVSMTFWPTTMGLTNTLREAGIA